MQQIIISPEVALHVKCGKSIMGHWEVLNPGVVLYKIKFPFCELKRSLLYVKDMYVCMVVLQVFFTLFTRTTVYI